MPSIVGAIASIIVAGVNKDTDSALFSGTATHHTNDYDQWWRQLAGMLATTVFAIITGVLTGIICNFVGPAAGGVDEFDDGEWWETADDFVPEKKVEAVAGGEIELVGQA